MSLFTCSSNLNPNLNQYSYEYEYFSNNNNFQYFDLNATFVKDENYDQFDLCDFESTIFDNFLTDFNQASKQFEKPDYIQGLKLPTTPCLKSYNNPTNQTFNTSINDLSVGTSLNSSYSTEGTVLVPIQCSMVRESEFEDSSDRNLQIIETDTEFKFETPKSKRKKSSSPNKKIQLKTPKTEKHKEINESKRSNKKTRRHRFNSGQVAMLEAEFSKAHYPDASCIDRIADSMGINFHTITVWFQNRRARLKRLET